MILALAGCFRVPGDWADPAIGLALDYHLDRPRVLAVRLDPPLLGAGQTVQIEALALGPTTVRSMTADLCGLRTDVPVLVSDLACFGNPDLVSPVGDVPGPFTAPDLTHLARHVPSPFDDTAVPDTGPWWADVGEAPGLAGSEVPLRVTARFDDGEAAGSLPLMLPFEVPGEGGSVPRALATLGPELRWVDGDAVAGGTVTLEMRLDAEPYPTGFAWWVDAGTLLGTGRTAVVDVEGITRISRNELVIPDDWRGPLRVAVTASAATSAVAVSGDVAWALLTLDVP